VLLGILTLLHGASSSEVRHLRACDINPSNQSIRFGKRPHPVPLDPASWQVLQRCLTHRGTQRTSNPHVIVTKGTKAGRSPASAAYTSHVLKPCGVPPRTLRRTRLAGLVNTMDPSWSPPHSEPALRSTRSPAGPGSATPRCTGTSRTAAS
jgi:integrase